MNVKVWLKKNWKWLVPCVVVLSLGLTFYFLGFRITYNPNIITNWDAISGCAAWAGVFISSILSLAAIWYAIQVPKKIAQEQNKIALFDKAFNIYDTIQHLMISGESSLYMKKWELPYKTGEGYRPSILVSLWYTGLTDNPYFKKIDSVISNVNNEEQIALLNKTNNELQLLSKQCQFLFPFSEEEYRVINRFLSQYGAVLEELCSYHHLEQLLCTQLKKKPETVYIDSMMDAQARLLDNVNALKSAYLSMKSEHILDNIQDQIKLYKLDLLSFVKREKQEL